MILTGFAALAVIGAFFIGYIIGKWSEARHCKEEE